MTDPLAKYVRGDGTTRYYDTEALAADLRRMMPVVEAAVAWDVSFRDPADPMGYEVDDKHDALTAAVRRYREGV